MSHRVRLPPEAILSAVVGVAATSVIIAAIESVIEIPNSSITYLLVVMLCAVTWGWWSALGAAVLAFLAYDWFFVEPRYTFHIRDPEEWVALLMFLAVAAVTSNLAARERERREEARRQARTATLLYDVSRALGGDDLDPALRAVGERVVAEFGLRGAVVAIGHDVEHPHTLVAVGEADPARGNGPAGRVFASGPAPNDPGRWVVVRGGPRRGVAAFPLRRDGQNWGALRLVGRPHGFADDETRTLAAIADRVAVALEREALQQEANQAEILRRTDELRTALLNSVSHDLRTPLAAIKASAESLLQKDVEWSESDRDSFAAAINRETDRLNRLVANLLDMSRIEGGALRPRREWYDIGELVHEVLGRVAPGLAEREPLIEVTDSLPPVPLDYLMIDQVLTNLVENAIKYGAAGGPIQVSARRQDDRVVVTVSDRGPGIPADARQRVFDKFFRLESRAAVRGSGLGLSVSRGLVEAHGGRIWVEPNPAGGSIFGFDLPLSPAGAGQEGVANEPDALERVS